MTEICFGVRVCITGEGKKMGSRAKVLGGALSVLLVLSACGGDDDSSSDTGSDSTSAPAVTEPAGETTPGTDAAGGGTIAFAHPHRAGDFYSALKAGAQEAADERGYELVESFADGSIEAQIAEVNTWLAQGEIDAITIHSLDVNAMAPLVESAHAEGVPWIAYATPVDGADGSVLFDDEQGARAVGEEAARWINEKLDGKAKIVMLGDDTIETPRVRLDVAWETIQELAPDAELVTRQDGLLSPEALTTMQSLLQSDPDINVVLCAADDCALGVSQAYKASGVDTTNVFVAGWDGSKAAMEKVLEGDVIRAVGAIDLNAVGRASVDNAANALEGKEPTESALPYVLITPDSVEDAERLISAFPT